MQKFEDRSRGIKNPDGIDTAEKVEQYSCLAVEL